MSVNIIVIAVIIVVIIAICLVLMYKYKTNITENDKNFMTNDLLFPATMLTQGSVTINDVNFFMSGPVTEEELKEIKRTKKIYLTMISRPDHEIVKIANYPIKTWSDDRDVVSISGKYGYNCYLVINPENTRALLPLGQRTKTESKKLPKFYKSVAISNDNRTIFVECSNMIMYIGHMPEYSYGIKIDLPFGVMYFNIGQGNLSQNGKKYVINILNRFEDHVEGTEDRFYLDNTKIYDKDNNFNNLDINYYQI